MKSLAVLFGLNYANTDDELNGCINDTLNMSNYLRENGFDNIEIFNDVENKGDTTQEGIIKHFCNIIKKSYQDNLDWIFFLYSGHGTNIECLEGDELDGRDECIVPTDYKKGNLISDDMIVNYLHFLNPKTRMVLIFDSCNSGTICDLKYRYVSKRIRIVENKSTICKAKILCIASCNDEQTSADVSNMSLGKSGGAMTSILLNLLRENPDYKKDVFLLIEKMKVELRNKGFTQKPQLTASYNLFSDVILLP